MAKKVAKKTTKKLVEDDSIKEKLWNPRAKKSAINKIIFHLEKGFSLRSKLREDNMPRASTFYNWLENDELLQERYRRACNIRQEELFEEMLDIADDKDNDLGTDPKTGKEVINREVIQRSQLRVSARQWNLARMNPTKYSERFFTSNETVVKQTPPDLSKLSTEELLLFKKLNAKLNS